MNDKHYEGKVNTTRGRGFEELIMKGCNYYMQTGRAFITKIPEPYIVTHKFKSARFEGRFTSNAEPDFKGILKGGTGIAFEAKYTSKDRMYQNVLTDTQAKMLEDFKDMGGISDVCISLMDRFFMLPIEIWQHMKSIFGRKYVTTEDIKMYEVKFDGSVKFLDYIK